MSELRQGAVANYFEQNNSAAKASRPSGAREEYGFLAPSRESSFSVTKYCAPHDDDVLLNLVDHLYVWLANRSSAVVRKASNIPLFGQRNSDSRVVSKCPLDGYPSSLRVLPFVASGIDRLLRYGVKDDRPRWRGH
jgi:hypothetical protein